MSADVRESRAALEGEEGVAPPESGFASAPVDSPAPIVPSIASVDAPPAPPVNGHPHGDGTNGKGHAAPSSNGHGTGTAGVTQGVASNRLDARPGSILWLGYAGAVAGIVFSLLIPTMGAGVVQKLVVVANIVLLGASGLTVVWAHVRNAIRRQ